MPQQNRIVVAGGSGFLGAGLTPELGAQGYEVVILTRGQAPPGNAERVRFVQWDARTPGPWAAELEGAAAVVNLVGRSVDCRKTPANRKVILASRVDSVRALAAACARCDRPPPVWVQSGT